MNTNSLAYNVIQEDNNIKKFIERMILYENKILNEYKKDKESMKSSNELEFSEELEKRKLFLKFKKESYKKQVESLQNLINYLNKLDKDSNDIDSIKELFFSIKEKLKKYDIV